jgi:hypothetical protein
MRGNRTADFCGDNARARMPLSVDHHRLGDIKQPGGRGAQIATEAVYIVTRHGECEHPHH